LRRRVVDDARAGRLRLLYVAPERFASEWFELLVRNIPVSRFVVDEAHCVSEWGHDFRPDYRRLRAAADTCRRSDHQSGRPPMAAFTATATTEVRDDIVRLLGLLTPEVLVAGFDRPNIQLQEIGRAGRDGRPATATLLWDPGDVQTREFLIDSPRRATAGPRHPAIDSEELARRKQIEHSKLRRMVSYAQTPLCLRGTILRYFGDPAARDRCDNCANCRSGAPRQPVSLTRERTAASDRSVHRRPWH
jgi:superfamily II DNA helicase RecQ